MLNKPLKHALNNARPTLSQAGVAHLAVFGSQARGQANADSDLDVLIEVQEGAKFSLIDLIGIEHLLTDATGIKVNAIMRRSADPAFKARIAPDAVEIF